MNPSHPVFIISKGRWNSCLTSRALEKIRVPYHLVIEKQEYDDYAKVVDPSKILVLPFSNLGQGSIPARNWVWEHSIEIGAKWHWILDDNIEAFHRLNQNIKPVVQSGTIFKVAEDFVDRYENVHLAGFNYYSLCKATDQVPPFYLNTRIYSCILVRNDSPFRWRGRYNEDTDLSLRILKAGYCTILFNAFLAGKMTTMRMKGGNTDNVYTDGDDRMKFAKSLEEQHPDVVRVVWKFNRWQHHVDYRPFKKNKLVRRVDIEIPTGENNYGMILSDHVDAPWQTRNQIGGKG